MATNSVWRAEARPSRGSGRMSPCGGPMQDSSEPSALKTQAAPPTFAASACVVSRHGVAAAGPTRRHGRSGAFGRRKGGGHEQRRERILRYKARGGLSRPFTPHAGWLPRERRRARVPPLRQPGAVSPVGSGRVGGDAPGDHDGGGGQADRAMIRRASRLTDNGRPLVASHSNTPTGEVSTRASRSARARLAAVGDSDVGAEAADEVPRGSLRMVLIVRCPFTALAR